MSKKPIITMLTDFGENDSYVGCMKGVILSIDSNIKIVDISHNIPSYNMASAAYMLTTYYELFPKGTVHMVVVDPGVGGSREAIAVELNDYYFVLPDNGIATLVINRFAGRYTARRIENPEVMSSNVSSTFHGRDIFAPAAAKLATGFDFNEIGPEHAGTRVIKTVIPQARRGKVEGSVVHIDKFGNYITNINNANLSEINKGALLVSIGGYTIMGLSKTYSEKEPGELIAYVGSTGNVEIGVVKGSAVDVIGLPAGSWVTVRKRGVD
ncbi:MAG TPA: SAM-dependent chlorinase/fluorinase [bacterium]|nr:SAM-dependent chlorinase/fluorinase [bacterium]